jgi:UDP-2,3-diacylglucosamine hydrolase
MIGIKDGAIFIADAHYDVKYRTSFYEFLTKIDSQEIKTTQLIFMGDMFELLVSHITYTKKQNDECIRLIDKISKKIDTIYIEGNHDFTLKHIFPHVLIVPITKQPLLCKFHDKTIALSHGDLFQTKEYNRYTKIIRNAFILKILNFIDSITNNSISKKILKDQTYKKKCTNHYNLYSKIKQKIQKYDIKSNSIDFVFEGHYHTDEVFTFEDIEYRIFSSFACDKTYFKIQFKEEIILQKIAL